MPSTAEFPVHVITVHPQNIPIIILILQMRTMRHRQAKASCLWLHSQQVMEQQFILRWVCLQGHFNYLNWTKCPILRELPAWKGSLKGKLRIRWKPEGRGKYLNHCGQEKHPPKGRLRFSLRRLGDEWDKDILAAGTECPKVQRHRTT